MGGRQILDFAGAIDSLGVPVSAWSQDTILFKLRGYLLRSDPFQRHAVNPPHNLCRFLVHFISGITIYRIYEPTELFNTTFANPYIYSAAYNGSYMVIDLVLCLVITALLSRPLSRYFAPQETVAAVKRNQGPEL